MSTGAVISRKQKAAFQSECTSLLGHRACGQKSPDCLTATSRAPPPPDSSLPLGPSSVVSSRKAAGQDIIPCYRHALVGSPQFSSLSLYVAPLQSLVPFAYIPNVLLCCLRTFSRMNLPYIRLLGTQWDHSLEYSLGSKLFENLFSPAAQLPSNLQP